MRRYTARRSAALFDSESIDWQMCAVRHTVRAIGLSWNSRQRRRTFGMLATNTWPSGSSVARSSIAAWNWVRKFDTEVVADRGDAVGQRRVGRYRGPSGRERDPDRREHDQGAARKRHGFARTDDPPASALT